MSSSPSVALRRQITYRMDSMVENKDRFQWKHQFVVDDYLCHVAPPFNGEKRLIVSRLDLAI